MTRITLDQARTVTSAQFRAAVTFEAYRAARMAMEGGYESAAMVADYSSVSANPGGHEYHLVALSEHLDFGTAPTPTEGKDRRQAGDALAVMRRREAQALADRTIAEERTRALEARIAELETRTPTVVTTPVSWGPQHPEWIPFWRQAAADAEAAGNCGEYDRHAAEMGGPTRSQLRNDGTGIGEGRVKRYHHFGYVTVSVDVPFIAYGGEDIGWSEIEEAVSNADFDGDALVSEALSSMSRYSSNYSIDSVETDTDGDNGDGVYWSAP